MRLQKYISRTGHASRREAERLIEAGRVSVNGTPATVLGTRIRPGIDDVRVDGVPLDTPELRWVLLHKPAGYLTTRSDTRGRRTVYDLLPPDRAGLAYVGRLDRDTEGLLLFTNDGDVSHALLHPSTGVEREYRAWVAGVVSNAVVEALVEGVRLDDGPARAHEATVSVRERARTLLTLVLREGRKREVRRLCEAVGHPVRFLERVRFGPIRLGDLERGTWRDLSDDEITALRAAAGMPRGGGGTQT